MMIVAYVVARRAQDKGVALRCVLFEIRIEESQPFSPDSLYHAKTNRE